MQLHLQSVCISNLRVPLPSPTQFEREIIKLMQFGHLTNLGLIGLTYPLAWESKRDLHHPFCTLKAVHQPAGACPCSPVNVQASLKVSHRLAVSYPSAGLRESKGVQLQLPSEGKGRVRQRSQTQRKSGCRDFTNGTTCFIVTQSKSLPMRFYHANIPVISVYENSTSITVY